MVAMVPGMPMARATVSLMLKPPPLLLAIGWLDGVIVGVKVDIEVVKALGVLEIPSAVEEKA